MCAIQQGYRLRFPLMSSNRMLFRYHRWVWMGVAVGLFGASPLFAQSSLARRCAQELMEAVGRKAESKIAAELAEAGGREAVERLLQRVAREGGENMVERAALLVQRFGISAMRALERQPAAMVRALEGCSPELVEKALWAVQREPEALGRLVSRWGAPALETAARHPGVGVRVMDQLGQDGIDLARKLSTDDLIRLSRHADDLAKIPAPQRGAVFTAISKAPSVVLDCLEKRPHLLKTAAGTAVILSVADRFTGGSRTIRQPDGTIITEPTAGLLGQMTQQFHRPLTAVILCAAAIPLAVAWSCCRKHRRSGSQDTFPG